MTFTLPLWSLIPLVLFVIPVVTFVYNEIHDTGYFSHLGTIFVAAVCWPAALAFVIAKLI